MAANPDSQVTVCIPVFNARKTIERCLVAVLRQAVPDMRVLVIDNASDDGTYELALKFLENGTGAQVVRNSRNLGRIENWNRCIELCETRYLKFALANDVLLPGSLQCLLDAAGLAEDTATVCSWFQEVQEIPEDLPAVADHPSAVVRSPSETARFFATNGFRTGGLNGMLFNRELIAQNGLRFRVDIPYCADYLLGIQLAALGATIFVDAATYYFHAGSTARFHFAGLKDPAGFFLEQRECALLLAEQTGDPDTGFRYLEGQYRWFLGQGSVLRATAAWAAFSGAPLKMQARAAWLTWRANLNRRLGRAPFGAVPH